MPVNVIWYLVLTILNALALVYKFFCLIQSGEYFFVFAGFDTLILACAFVYFGYMLASQLGQSNRSEGASPLVSENSSGFMVNQFFKFIFSFAVGALFLATLISKLYSKFQGNIDNWLYWLCGTYCWFILPICCIIELWITTRGRSPNPTQDLIIMLIILGIFGVCEFLANIFRDGSPFPNILYHIANFLSRAIFSFDGYILYDFLTYKTSGGSGSFTLFYSTQDPK